MLSIRDYLIVLITNTSHKAHLLSCALRCSSRLQEIQILENFISMAIQGTQLPIYTNTHYFCIFLIFLFLFLFIWKKNKAKTEKQPNKNIKRNTQSIKLDANAWERRRKRRDHSLRITPMFWHRNSNRLLSRSLVNKSAFWSSVGNGSHQFHQFRNEGVMPMSK